MKASAWESFSCRSCCPSVRFVPICFHQCKQLSYWWPLSALCPCEHRTFWDCGETGSFSVAANTAAPTRESISVENTSTENTGMLLLLSGVCEHTTTSWTVWKAGIQGGKGSLSKTCWVSCPCSPVHWLQSWSVDVSSFSHSDLRSQPCQGVSFPEAHCFCILEVRMKGLYGFVNKCNRKIIQLVV